ncbi:MAG: hypothetical protein VX699_02895 [Myxococcota bacterium]|nr:hypothetical protein [Myxococcota bacterium]
MNLPPSSARGNPFSALLGPLCAALISCGNPNEEQLSLSETTITYRLDWDTTGASQNDTGAWTWQSDLGFNIELTGGYLVTYSLQLVECRTNGLASWRHWLQELLGPRAAFAGHPHTQRNPAAMTPPHVESLLNPRAQHAGSAIAPAATYCQSHYLIAGAPPQAKGLPEDVNMLGTSLYLQGHYQAPDSPEWVRFKIHSALPNGVLTPLVPPGDSTAPVEVETTSLTLTTSRSLATLLNGVDFTTMDTHAIQRQVLTSIITETRTHYSIP